MEQKQQLEQAILKAQEIGVFLKYNQVKKLDGDFLVLKTSDSTLFLLSKEIKSRFIFPIGTTEWKGIRIEPKANKFKRTKRVI